MDRQAHKDLQDHKAQEEDTEGTLEKAVHPVHQDQTGEQVCRDLEEDKVLLVLRLEAGEEDLNQLKPENLPEWDGNPLTAIEYFWQIQQMALMGGWIPEALGYWLWTRLKKTSSVYKWFMALPTIQQAAMRAHHLTYLRGIKEGFLGRTWLLQMNLVFEQQSFRQEGHAKEKPQEFIVRSITYARMLANVDQGGAQEVFVVLQKAPIPWGPILIMENIRDTATLYARCTDHENALVHASRVDSARPLTSDNLVSALKALGYDRGRPTGVRRVNAINSDEVDEEVEDEPQTTSDFVPVFTDSDATDESGDDIMIKEAFQVLKKRQRAPPKGGYPFPKNDHVTTKMGKMPPSPCKVCGSKNHWDRECRNWAVYDRGLARTVNFTSFSSEDDTAESIYRNVYNILMNRRLAKTSVDFSRFNNPGFEAAASNPVPEGRETRKTATKPPSQDRPAKLRSPSIEEVEDKEEVLEREREVAREYVIESIYGPSASDTLLRDDLPLADWQGTPEDDSKRETHQSTKIPNPSPAPEEDEGFPTTSSNEGLPKTFRETPTTEPRNAQFIDASGLEPAPPQELAPRRLTKFKKSVAGLSSVGVSVLAMRGWVADLQNAIIELRLDSCADISLISEAYFKSLKNAPFATFDTTGHHWSTNVKVLSPLLFILWALSFEVLTLSEQGELIETEVETYIVKGMTVPILLGEDYHINYNLSVIRNAELGTTVLFDKGEVVVKAQGVRRTEDWQLAKGAAAISSKFVRTRIHHQNQTRKQRMKRKWGEEDGHIRAAEHPMC
ncbi:hypothetical protein C8R46DRAFT_1213104 [Mycena filopes]|nr:hypothetical protein C8R46DRAFT_1213104 [Mycena filopes]